MSKITVETLRQHRRNGTKFSMVTAYDSCFASLISDAGIDSILVGDSLGMILQGYASTLRVSIQDMAYHTRCVTAASPNSLIITDMPFMASATIQDAMNSARVLVQSGAEVVKIEGQAQLIELVKLYQDQGVATCCHLGLTPQFVNRFGGYKVQGKTDDSSKRLIDTAALLDDAGADILLLECVPTRVTEEIMSVTSKAPVVGIGAGAATTGQVLVMHDLLGISPGKMARFVRNFMTNASTIREAFEAFDQAVKNKSFPSQEHSFE